MLFNCYVGLVPDPALPTHDTARASWVQADLHRAAEMGPLVDAVTTAMAMQGYDSRACMELRLVLEEAIVNGLHHGNRRDPTKRVRVRYQVRPDAVLADVEDEGPGFDPTAVPDPTAPENLDKPSGRGLLLMRHFTSWLHFHGPGNRLSFGKHRLAR